MKRIATIVLPALSLLFAGCGAEAAATPEGIANQAAEQIKTLTTKLEGIKDEASAKAAQTSLKPIVDTLNGLGDKMKALGAPLQGMQGKISGILKEPVAKLQSTIQGLMAKPEIQKHLEGLNLQSVVAAFKQS